MYNVKRSFKNIHNDPAEWRYFFIIATTEKLLKKFSPNQTVNSIFSNQEIQCSIEDSNFES